MNHEILEDNLRRLLSVAPERARLRPMARERIKRALRESGAPPLQQAPTPTRTRWTPILAAAAAMTLLSLGAWRLIGERADPTGGASQGAPSGSVADAGSQGARDPVAGVGTPKAAVSDLSPGSSAASGGGREAIATEDPPSGLASVATGEEGASVAPEAAGQFSEAPQLLAAVELPDLDPEGATGPPLGASLTLWVKPVVNLPLVADPTPFEVPIEFPVEGNGARRAATLSVAAAMGQVIAMGSKEAILQIEYAGFAPSRLRVSLEEAAQGSVRFALERGVSVSGQVIEAETGAPIAGAVVVAIDQLPLDALDVAVDPGAERLPRPYAVADEFGRFTIDQVAATEGLRLRASHAGLAPTIATIPSGSTGPEDLLTIELRPGSIVTGLVEKPDGTPWKGAFLVVSRQEVDPAMTERPVMTFGAGLCDDAGVFRIEGMPSGQYVALLFDPARPRYPLEFRQVRLDGPREVRVDFRSGVSTVGLDVAGTLVDQQGAPVQGASLSLSNLDGSMDLTSDWRVTDTDASGQFQFADLQPSDYAIHLAADGFAQMALVWEGGIENSQDLRIALPATSWRLAGLGAVGEGQSWSILERWRAAGNEWVYAGRAGTRQQGSTRVASLEHLLPGRYRAVYVGPGHGATWTEPFELEADRPRDGQLDLLPGGTLTLRAVDASTGEPLEGFSVTAVDADGHEVPQQDVVRTGPEGRAVILGAPFGTLTLRLKEAPGPEGAPRRLLEQTVEFDVATSLVECSVAPR